MLEGLWLEKVHPRAPYRASATQRSLPCNPPTGAPPPWEGNCKPLSKGAAEVSAEGGEVYWKPAPELLCLPEEVRVAPRRAS